MFKKRQIAVICSYLEGKANNLVSEPLKASLEFEAGGKAMTYEWLKACFMRAKSPLVSFAQAHLF